MRRHVLFLAPLACFAFAVACSSSGGDDAFGGSGSSTQGKSGSSGKGKGGTTSATEEICVPAATRECACENEDEIGFETCDEEGAAWGECLCEAAPASGGAGPGSGGKSGAGGKPGGMAGASGAGDEGGQGGNLGEGGSDGEGGAGGNPFDSGDGGSDDGGAGSTGAGCVADPDEDKDQDGWTITQGDCNDCSNLVNPGAFDKAGDMVDSDCDGTVDNAPTACDAGLGEAIANPTDAAKAIGLCSIGVAPEGTTNLADRKWGVISANFSAISGEMTKTPPSGGASVQKQLGILPNFGSATPPQEGVALFSLSSGIARAKGQKDAPSSVCNSDAKYSSSSSYPSGFPKAGDCGTTGDAKDGIGLDMAIRVPTNAKGFKVRLKFFTCEYPMYTCSVFNDVFAILMTPSPLAAGDPMTDGGNALANIAFETTAAGGKNVIGVNNTSFLTACKKQSFPPNAAKYKNCAGESGLSGSGFEGHAASSWLTTTVPVPAFPAGADRVIKLRFAIWDSNDQRLDSTAVVDGFEWETEAPKGTETRVDN